VSVPPCPCVIGVLTCANADHKGVLCCLKELAGQDAAADQHLTLTYGELIGGQLQQLTLCREGRQVCTRGGGGGGGGAACQHEGKKRITIRRCGEGGQVVLGSQLVLAAGQQESGRAKE